MKYHYDYNYLDDFELVIVFFNARHRAPIDSHKFISFIIISLLSHFAFMSEQVGVSDHISLALQPVFYPVRRI